MASYIWWYFCDFATYTIDKCEEYHIPLWQDHEIFIESNFLNFSETWKFWSPIITRYTALRLCTSVSFSWSPSNFTLTIQAYLNMILKIFRKVLYSPVHFDVCCPGLGEDWNWPTKSSFTGSSLNPEVLCTLIIKAKKTYSYSLYCPLQLWGLWDSGWDRKD